MDKVDLSKKIEVCREMNELKSKWESGKVSKEHREPAKVMPASLSVSPKICFVWHRVVEQFSQDRANHSS